MTLKTAFQIWILLLLVGCQGNDFHGADGAEKETSSGEKKDEDQAKKPASVGGAYLNCRFDEYGHPDYETTIGCTILSADSGQKLDLGRYKQEWILSESGARSDTPSEEQPPESIYHRAFHYRDDSYKRERLNVAIEDDKGVRSEFSQSLDSLSWKLQDQVFARWRITPKQGLGQFQPPRDENDILGWAGAFANAFATNYCDPGGDLNGLFVLQQFGINASQDYNAMLVMNNSNRRCVITNDEFQVMLKNECIVIPVLEMDQTGKYSAQVYVAQQRFAGRSFEEISRWVNEYRCQ